HPLPTSESSVTEGEVAMSEQSRRRCIGLDVHRDFAQVAIWQGGVVSEAGRFATTPEGGRAFAAGLGPGDEGAVEATGNSWAMAALLASRAGRVVVSNPVKTRAIAEANVKTDKVDAQILAQLLAADFLPPVWRPDAQTAALRRQVLRRAHLVRQRTRLKNQVHAILHRNLIPRCPASDLFGIKGRAWLAGQLLPPDENATATALIRQLDFHGEELALIDGDLARIALGRDDVHRLDEHPRCRRDRRVVDRGRGRRGHPVPQPGQVGLLFRAQPPGAAIRRTPGQPRADHQGRPWTRPRHA